jgi:hypothetical protein
MAKGKEVGFGEGVGLVFSRLRFRVEWGMSVTAASMTWCD